MTKAQLLRNMSSHEIAEWHAFYAIEADEVKRHALDSKAIAGHNAIRKRKR